MLERLTFTDQSIYPGKISFKQTIYICEFKREGNLAVLSPEYETD